METRLGNHTWIDDEEVDRILIPTCFPSLCYMENTFMGLFCVNLEKIVVYTLHKGKKHHEMTNLTLIFIGS